MDPTPAGGYWARSDTQNGKVEPIDPAVIDHDVLHDIAVDFIRRSQ